MNTDLLLVYVQSFFEAFWLFTIISTININVKFGVVKSLVIPAILAALALIMDIYGTPYYAAFSIIASVALFLLFKRPARELVGYYIIDVLVSFVVVMVIQFVITSIAGLFSFDLLDNSVSILIILAIFIALFKWLSSKVYVHIFFEKYYLPYRTTILFAIISILFLMVIVLNIVSSERASFFINGSISINLLVIGYFIINMFFIVTLYRAKHATESRNVISGYSEYLQEIVNAYRASSHDLKHHLQIIQTFNTAADGTAKNEELDVYIQSLIEDGLGAGDTSLIKDDIFISALLLQKKEYATRKKIDFTVNMMSLLSNYSNSIPHTELIDVLNNLIDNAFEEVEKLDIENRVVQLDFADYYIEIRNKVSLSLSVSGTDQTDRFFDQGYTTKKGVDRGFGLSNVLSIAKRNHIEIKNKLIDGMIVFRLEFGK